MCRSGPYSLRVCWIRTRDTRGSDYTHSRWAVSIIAVIELRAADGLRRHVVDRVLHDADEAVRERAAHALTTFLCADDMDALIHALDDPSTVVRRQVIDAIGYVYETHQGPHRHAVPRLLELKDDRDEDIRLAAVAALRRFGVEME